MKQYFAYCLLLVVFFIYAPMLGASTSFTPRSTTVITTGDHPFSGLRRADDFNPPIQMVNLDAVLRFEERLGEFLPADEVQATALVRQRITLIGPKQLNIDLRAAYEAIVLSMLYGLDRYPAVVFDKQAVVYGVTDLSVALEKYQRWREVSLEEPSGE